MLDELNDFNAEEEVKGAGATGEEEGFDDFVDAPVSEPPQEVRTAPVDLFAGEPFQPPAAGRETPVQVPPPASMDLFNIKPIEGAGAEARGSWHDQAEPARLSAPWAAAPQEQQHRPSVNLIGDAIFSSQPVEDDPFAEALQEVIRLETDPATEGVPKPADSSNAQPF